MARGRGVMGREESEGKRRGVRGGERGRLNEGPALRGMT